MQPPYGAAVDRVCHPIEGDPFVSLYDVGVDHGDFGDPIARALKLSHAGDGSAVMSKETSPRKPTTTNAESHAVRDVASNAGEIFRGGTNGRVGFHAADPTKAAGSNTVTAATTTSTLTANRTRFTSAASPRSRRSQSL